MAKKTTIRDDFDWIRGANFIPSYAATSVIIWNKFDPSVVDRELGYAERLKLNSVRVFLQYHVYELYPTKFLKNLSTFVTLCEKHKMRPMLVLFDSCFGVSPSIASAEFWVANPGPDRTNPEFYSAGENYVKDITDLFKDDPRVVILDIMNEPTATPLALTENGKKQIWDFVRHFCDYVHTIDTMHPITVGVPGWDNSDIIDRVDVVSLHSYNKTPDGFRDDIRKAREQAQKAGKPLIISECCAPGWGNQYEWVMPILREESIGFYIWEVMIGKAQFRTVSGLFYPDGTVRRLSQIEAVLGKAATGFVEKHGSEGISIDAGVSPEQLARPAFKRMTGSRTNDENFSERYTALEVLSRHYKTLGDRCDEVSKEIDVVAAMRKQGKHKEAFRRVDELLKLSERSILAPHEKK